MGAVRPVGSGFVLVDIGQLRGYRSRTVVASEAFDIEAFHVAVCALFVETVLELLVLAQTEGVGAAHIVHDAAVMTVPAGI